MSDARFEDGAEQPLRLIARDAADLQVISAFVQDAVLSAAEMRWLPARRRFALLMNRFRWEDRDRAAAAGRPVERVQAMLVIDDVTRVTHQGLDRRDRDMVLSLLALDWQPDAPVQGADGDGDSAEAAPAGPGRLVLVLAGDGAVALQTECLEVALHDVTRPYAAPSGRAPAHPLDP